MEPVVLQKPIINFNANQATTFNSWFLSRRSCVFIDGNGGTHEVDLEDMHTSKADQLGKTSSQILFLRSDFLHLQHSKMSLMSAPFSAKIIDGINQSEARRRALMLFCFTHLDANVKVSNVSYSSTTVHALLQMKGYRWLWFKIFYKLFRMINSKNMQCHSRITENPGITFYEVMIDNVFVKDAYMLSIDRKGFDVLGKGPSPVVKDDFEQYQWKEYRFSLKEEARDVETFCRQLVEMEEEAVKKVSSFSGLGWKAGDFPCFGLYLWKNTFYLSIFLFKIHWGWDHLDKYNVRPRQDKLMEMDLLYRNSLFLSLFLIIFFFFGWSYI